MKNRGHKRGLALTILLMLLMLTGCSESTFTETETQEMPAITVSETPEDETETEETQTSQQTETQTETVSETESTVFSLSDIPDYSGDPYTAVNGNVPYFTEEDLTTESFETYSSLDELGRCGAAFALIGTELMPDEERGEIGEVRPSGWHTVKYQGVISDNYLYNRCHLIAYELAGENANERNLITGTRYLNVEGMLPFENRVADYVKDTDHHVLYRVTPEFEEDDLVCRGVLMEAYSVEDNGKGICFNVFCYNVQPYVEIDYTTGDSTLTGEGEKLAAAWEAEQTEAAETEKTEVSDTVSDGVTYILNTNTKKFHYPTCSSVDQMAEHNKEAYSGSRQDLIDQGYDPCGRCNP